MKTLKNAILDTSCSDSTCLANFILFTAMGTSKILLWLIASRLSGVRALVSALIAL